MIDLDSDKFIEFDFKLDSFVGNERFLRVWYSYGRVVWELVDNCIIVDNFDIFKRFIIMWLRDKRMIFVVLSNELVVLSNVDDQEIV